MSKPFFVLMFFFLWLSFSFLLSKIDKSKSYIIFGGLGLGIISFVFLSYFLDYLNERAEYNAAVKVGFTTVQEHKEAKSRGLDTKQQYEIYKEEQAKVLAEKQRIAKEEQKKNEEERKQKEEKCKQDLTCLAKDNFASATVYCGTYIEKLAKYDFKWTDESWFEQKFSHFRWKNKENGVITYIGDKAMFQNGFGAWQAHIYECDFDTKSEKVLDVRARPGRLQ